MEEVGFELSLEGQVNSDKEKTGNIFLVKSTYEQRCGMRRLQCAGFRVHGKSDLSRLCGEVRETLGLGRWLRDVNVNLRN